MSKQMGRPIVPTSARQKEPWKAHGVSRATFYWRKAYGDVREPKYPFFDDPDIGVEYPAQYPHADAHDIGVEGCERPF